MRRARDIARTVPPGERSFKGERASCMMCGKMTVLTWVEETCRYHWIARGEPADPLPRCDGDTAWCVDQPKLTPHVPKFRRWDYAGDELIHATPRDER